LLAFAPLACGGADDGRNTGSGSGPLSGLSLGDTGMTSDATGGGEAPSEEASSDPSADADPSGPKFDLDEPMGGDLPPTQEGCTKVDVVISVDNSSSMTEEIAALQGPVFDSFPETLLDINNGLDDFQLGLIDACPKPAALHDSGDGGLCGYSTGTNFMVSTSPALAAEFSCATELPFMAGWSGGNDNCSDSADDDEQPGLTTATVVSPPFVDDANAGFVRPDAVLMAVAITDEDEQLVDAGNVQEIYDMLVDAKGGDATRVAFLGIAGGSNCDGAYGSAQNATDAQALAALFEAADRGMFWDLCQGQLELAFETFISTVVDEACAEFEPEG
jgi:hypothetical protein